MCLLSIIQCRSGHMTNDWSNRAPAGSTAKRWGSAKAGRTTTVAGGLPLSAIGSASLAANSRRGRRRCHHGSLARRIRRSAFLLALRMRYKSGHWSLGFRKLNTENPLSILVRRLEQRRVRRFDDSSTKLSQLIQWNLVFITPSPQFCIVVVSVPHSSSSQETLDIL